MLPGIYLRCRGASRTSFERQAEANLTEASTMPLVERLRSHEQAYPSVAAGTMRSWYWYPYLYTYTRRRA